MIKKELQLIIAISFAFILLACGDNEKKADNLGTTQKVKQAKVVEKEIYLINDHSVLGLTVGEPIKSYEEQLTKGKIRNGDGIFEVYNLEKNGDEVAYLMPDQTNEKLVGNITIQSSRAETAEGIKIGSTWEELQHAYPKIEVHGSEIESRVYATKGNISFRLDFLSNQYDLDVSTIPKKCNGCGDND